MNVRVEVDMDGSRITIEREYSIEYGYAPMPIAVQAIERIARELAVMDQAREAAS